MKKPKAEKWPKRAIGHKLDMFQSTVVLVRSYEEWNAAASHLKGVPLDQINPKRLYSAKRPMAGAATWYGSSDRLQTIFMVGVFDGRLRTLIHELTHAVFHICDYYGIPTNSGDTNEFFCYLLEHLTHEFKKYCKK